MTLITALKTGERIVVMSDTAISDRDAIRADLLPGRLKSITLGPRRTVSYAGLSAQALDVIRRLHRENIQSDEEVISRLRGACSEFSGEVEFLACFHDDSKQARLVKITSSGVAEGANTYWIGNGDAARSLASMELEIPPRFGDLPSYVTQEEINFTYRFSKFIELHSDFVVGGAAITCVCSSNGHGYQSEAGATMLKPVQVPDPVPPEVREAEARTGMSRFAYHIYGPQERGIAVVGFYLEQAATGYLHMPLFRDDALKVTADDQEAFSRIVIETSLEKKADSLRGTQNRSI